MVNAANAGFVHSPDWICARSANLDFSDNQHSTAPFLIVSLLSLQDFKWNCGELMVWYISVLTGSGKARSKWVGENNLFLSKGVFCKCLCVFIFVFLYLF